MFDVGELKQIYNPAYFGSEKDHYVWTEHQTNPKALAKVEFLFKGGVIGYVKSGLLKEMQDAYRGDSTATLNLRTICDGVLFLDRGEEHYFVILEVKSGFGDVKKRAINQIPASYVKTKSILNDFSSYNKGNFIEFGLIVSYPYVPYTNTDSENNPVVMENKRKMIGDKNEKIVSKYNKLLQDHQTAIFFGSDFEFDNLTKVKSDLFFDQLKVKHYPTTNHCVNTVIDLDNVIRTL